MTKLLQEAINKIQQLSPEQQDAIAILIFEELENQLYYSNCFRDDDEWDLQMKNDLESGKLDKLIAQAEANIKGGKFKEIDEILCNS